MSARSKANHLVHGPRPRAATNQVVAGGVLAFHMITRNSAASLQFPWCSFGLWKHDDSMARLFSQNVVFKEDLGSSMARLFWPGAHHATLQYDAR
ncbi:hypothetical protein ACP70R_033849 [Stipagrostis hirtigluma subsp. patula]